jgi:hypothetical protein
MGKWMFVLTLAALGVSVAAYPMPAQPRPVEPTTQQLMKKKLEHAQHLLGALSLNDLQAAGKDAENLLRIRQEAAFRALKTPEYDFCAERFQQSAEGIIKAAKTDNLEAAKLHYLGTT